jgi:hypothetical protein
MGSEPKSLQDRPVAARQAQDYSTSAKQVLPTERSVRIPHLTHPRADIAFSTEQSPYYRGSVNKANVEIRQKNRVLVGDHLQFMASEYWKRESARSGNDRPLCMAHSR